MIFTYFEKIPILGILNKFFEQKCYPAYLCSTRETFARKRGEYIYKGSFFLFKK